MERFDVKAVFFFFPPHCQGALRNLVIWLPKYCSRLLWLGRGVRLDCNLYLYQSLFVSGNSSIMLKNSMHWSIGGGVMFILPGGY